MFHITLEDAYEKWGKTISREDLASFMWYFRMSLTEKGGYISGPDEIPIHLEVKGEVQDLEYHVQSWDEL